MQILNVLSFLSLVDLLQGDLLASGASFFGREAADRERRSRERSRHMKSDEGLFWKSISLAELRLFFELANLLQDGSKYWRRM